MRAFHNGFWQCTTRFVPKVRLCAQGDEQQAFHARSYFGGVKSIRVGGILDVRVVMANVLANVVRAICLARRSTPVKLHVVLRKHESSV